MTFSESRSPINKSEIAYDGNWPWYKMRSAGKGDLSVVSFDQC